MINWMRIVWGVCGLMLAAAVVYLGFYLDRREVQDVQLYFGAAFLALLGLYFVTKWANWTVSIWWIFVLGLGIRATLLFSTPNLSDDYFRFTWDGYLVNKGYNPFDLTPEEFVCEHWKDSITMELYNAHSEAFPDGMNSKGHYSIYPTVNQGIYALSFTVGTPNEGNLIAIKIALLIFEIISFYFLLKLLECHNRSRSLSLLYWLNPLVIVEIMGNMHFEGIAVSFILIAVFYIESNRVWYSGIALAFAIATKLNPLFLACVNWNLLTGKKLFSWWAITGIATVLMLMVFLNHDNVWNFKKSIDLYLNVFRFNAGLLTTCASIHYFFFGTTSYYLLMAWFPTITLIGILALNRLNSKWTTSDRLLLAFTIYFTFATTVHPWYIIFLIPFAVIGNWRYPLIWSYVVVWSYWSYQKEGAIHFDELTVVSFLLLACLMWWDIRRQIKLKAGNYA